MHQMARLPTENLSPLRCQSYCMFAAVIMRQPAVTVSTGSRTHPQARPPVDTPDALGQADSDQCTGDSLGGGHRQACRAPKATHNQHGQLALLHVCPAGCSDPTDDLGQADSNQSPMAVNHA